MQRLSLYATDETRLQRTVPYLVILLRDPLPSLRAAAVRALTQVLSSVRSVTSADTNIFPEFIFPAMTALASDSAKGVKLAFIESLAHIAVIIKSFLDLYHAERQRLVVICNLKKVDNENAEDGADNNGATYSSVAGQKAIEENSSSISMNPNVVVNGSYDFEVDRLRDIVGNIISSLVAATRRPSPQVHGSGAEAPSSGNEAANSIIKRALLRNLASLCDFFGSDYTNDKVFLWMISFMNERKDWELRKTFFQCISIVSPYLPSMIPTMITFIEDAFADGHEIVVKEATIVFVFSDPIESCI